MPAWRAGSDVEAPRRDGRRGAAADSATTAAPPTRLRLLRVRDVRFPAPSAAFFYAAFSI